MRAEAENANVRARARKDVDDTRQYAVQKFATDVVEAAENLKRGIDSLPPPSADQPAIVAKVREGLEGVERSFISTLERNGIKREDPVGQSFDPNLHQAMAEQESETHGPGTVIHAWSKAWTLNGRLLRPAMVVVAKAPTSELAGPAKAIGPGARPIWGYCDRMERKIWLQHLSWPALSHTSNAFIKGTVPVLRAAIVR